MGWWWNSSSQKDDSSAPQQQPQQQQQQQIHDAPQQTQTLTRDEQELKQFLEAFEKSGNEADAKSNKSTTTSPSSQSNPSASTPPSSIAPDSLYPDSMSCRSAFDYAFFCQSFGGQFVNVYRYGELRSCSEHWENFWLCMRTRTYGDRERGRIIRDHYRKKAIKYKTGPSSEDVWDMRMEPVKTAFQGDFAALEREMREEGQGV